MRKAQKERDFHPRDTNSSSTHSPLVRGQRSGVRGYRLELYSSVSSAQYPKYLIMIQPIGLIQTFVFKASYNNACNKDQKGTVLIVASDKDHSVLLAC